MTVQVPKEKLMSAEERRELIERPLSIRYVGSASRWGGTELAPVDREVRKVHRHTSMVNEHDGGRQ